MRLKAMAERFDARPQRERLIMATMTLLLVVAMLVQFLIEPVLRRSTVSEQQLAVVQARLDSLESQLPALEAAAGRDPDLPLDALHASMTRSLLEVDETLQARMQRVVEPAEMVAALQMLLRESSGVRLREVRNVLPAPVTVAERQDATTEPGISETTPRLYRHGLKITLEGDFFSLLNYVLQVERHERRFAWKSLRLVVEAYPKALLEIELQTLSLDAGWLDV